MIQGIQDLGPGSLLQDQFHHHLHGTELRIPTLFQPVLVPTSPSFLRSSHPAPLGHTLSSTLAFRPIHRRSWCRKQTRPGAAARRDCRNSTTLGKCSTQRRLTTSQLAAAANRSAAGPTPGGRAIDCGRPFLLSFYPGFPDAPAGGAPALSSAPEGRRTGWVHFAEPPESCSLFPGGDLCVSTCPDR